MMSSGEGSLEVVKEAGVPQVVWRNFAGIATFVCWRRWR
jgi:hypothetical protein